MEQKIDEQFSCIICLQIAKNAFETSCCHQICCEECKKSLPKPVVCPACRNENVNFLVSHIIRRVIESFTCIKSDPETKPQKKARDFSLTKNKDGAEIFTSMDYYHQKKKMIYCGRNVGYDGYNNPCGHCDGRCGPPLLDVNALHVLNYRVNLTLNLID